jgi:hypothetical protein
MGLFDGRYVQRRMAFKGVDIDSDATLTFSAEELLTAAQECSLRAWSRPMGPGKLKVEASPLDSVGGFIHESGDVIWFFKGPEKKVSMLMDRFLKRTLDRSDFFCCALPEEY